MIITLEVDLGAQDELSGDLEGVREVELVDCMNIAHILYPWCSDCLELASN